MVDYLYRMITGRPRQKLNFLPDGRSVAKCPRCYALLKARAGLRLISHLAEEHGLDHDAAIETVAWVYKQLKKELDKPKGGVLQTKP